MTATSIFIRINVWLKLIIHLSTVIFYVLINKSPSKMNELVRDCYQGSQYEPNWAFESCGRNLSHLFHIVMIAIILHLIDGQVEYILSLNIQWNKQLESDRIESQTVGQINRVLLENILPPHVLRRYLYSTSVSYDQLYHESVSNSSSFFWKQKLLSCFISILCCMLACRYTEIRISTRRRWTFLMFVFLKNFLSIPRQSFSCLIPISAIKFVVQ